MGQWETNIGQRKVDIYINIDIDIDIDTETSTVIFAHAFSQTPVNISLLFSETKLCLR